MVEGGRSKHEVALARSALATRESKLRSAPTISASSAVKYARGRLNGLHRERLQPPAEPTGRAVVMKLIGAPSHRSHGQVFPHRARWVPLRRGGHASVSDAGRPVSQPAAVRVARFAGMPHTPALGGRCFWQFVTSACAGSDREFPIPGPRRKTTLNVLVPTCCSVLPILSSRRPTPESIQRSIRTSTPSGRSLIAATTIRRPEPRRAGAGDPLPQASSRGPGSGREDEAPKIVTVKEAAAVWTGPAAPPGEEARGRRPPQIGDQYRAGVSSDEVGMNGLFLRWISERWPWPRVMRSIERLGLKRRLSAIFGYIDFLVAHGVADGFLPLGRFLSY